MANGSTHMLVGAATGLIIAGIDKKKHPTSHNAVTATALGAFFGKFPDILEPSLNNPHHRQFYHSLLVLGSLTYGLKKLYDWEPENGFETIMRDVSLIAGCSYLSHLALDSLTPRSLPLLGKL